MVYNRPNPFIRPLPPSPPPVIRPLSPKINPLMDKYGLMGRAGDVISLAPPLCITRDEVDHLVKSLDGIITELETKL